MKYKTVKHETINIVSFYITVGDLKKVFGVQANYAERVAAKLPELHTLSELESYFNSIDLKLYLRDLEMSVCEKCGKVINPMTDSHYHGDGTDYCYDCGDEVLVKFVDGDNLYIHEDQDSGAEAYLDDAYSDLEFFEFILGEPDAIV